MFAEDTAPIVNLSVAAINEPAQFVKTINIAIILTLLVLAPTLLLMVTSFTRIVIVFSLSVLLPKIILFSPLFL